MARFIIASARECDNQLISRERKRRTRNNCVIHPARASRAPSATAGGDDAQDVAALKRDVALAGEFCFLAVGQNDRICSRRRGFAAAQAVRAAKPPVAEDRAFGGREGFDSRTIPSPPGCAPRPPVFAARSNRRTRSGYCISSASAGVLSVFVM